MPGLPLHKMVTSIDRRSILSIIKEILDTIYSLPKSLNESFEIAVLQELMDIDDLINNRKIKQASFEVATKGLSPQQALNNIKNSLKNHKAEVLSHGDLCLPNIIVTSKSKWSLIDWGKSGFSDRYRDLASLKISLNRNIDDQAFEELCKMMNIKITQDFQQKINLYKMIDLFWYNAII